MSVRRNEIICFDGTGQNRSQKTPEEWSNVTLLHDAIATTTPAELIQVRKYIDGVGTRPGEELTGGGFGIDLDKRIEEAYEFLYQEINNDYESDYDPHIYIFGFSRGAYAARWLASLVQFAGIPKDGVSPVKLMHYHEKNNVDAIADLRNRGKLWMDVPIDFVGVWDTVESSINPSFGIIDIPAIVKKAYHALAIDEWRSAFEPTRFNPSEKVTEVWFPGCHTDVGGGYAERAIANESLWWMIDGAEKAGMMVDEDAIQKAIDGRSTELKFHDELAGSKFWKGLNAASGIAGKFFRTIKDGDLLHPSVQMFAANAPSDRQLIPDTCVAWNDDMRKQRGIEIA